MTTQSDALRLADRLESDFIRSQTMVDAAAELRRLHAENECIRSALNGWIKANNPGGWIDDLRTQSDALLEALIRCRNRFFPSDQPERDRDELWEPVNAAIKAVEEGK